MAEMNQNKAVGSNCFKEAVCIDAGRIYDSCSDRDCLEDLKVMFTDAEQPTIDKAVSVKCKDVEILDVYINVEPVPFNKGFYSVDITFFFSVKLNAYLCPIAAPTLVEGIASFSKKVILYGSEGNVKVYSSQSCNSNPITNLPKATVQVVDPICLDVKLVDCCIDCAEPEIAIPKEICNQFSGEFTCCPAHKCVYITLGLFTIIQIERSVQMMIPAYDYCVPDSKGGAEISSQDPCELFQKIKFPTNEFFPPRLNDLDD